MKKCILLLALCCGACSPPTKPPEITVLSKAQKVAAVQYFESDAEPMVSAARWDLDAGFTITVEDDGSLRDGYAMYACDALKSMGIDHPALTARVVDEQTRKLGRVRCSNYEPF